MKIIPLSLLALAASLSACSGPSAEPEAPLPPPPSGAQITSPEFTLQPGEEVFKCFYTSLPAEQEVAVGRFRSLMTPGSHHLILYATEDALRPDGTFDDCGDAAPQVGPRSLRVWLYAAQDPEHHHDMPAGVAVPLKARQPLILNMHYINVGNTPLNVKAVVNAEYAAAPFERAGAFVTFNTQIAVPPQGVQTVSGTCSVPTGARFFTMSTHSHRFTTGASVTTVRDAQPLQQLLRTDDWEHPAVVNWAAPYMTLGDGESIRYECSYKNDTDDTIKVGESAAKNEMCMAVGYYFPATGTTFCINSYSVTR
jgi:hypothetical protein